MRTWVILLAFFVTSIPFSVKATDRQAWLAHMRSELPGVLCQPDQYFMKCFNNTQTECLEASQSYVNACVDNSIVGLPPQLDEAQGKFWGQMVGRCAFDLYEKFMQSKKLQKPECKTQSPRSP